MPRLETPTAGPFFDSSAAEYSGWRRNFPECRGHFNYGDGSEIYLLEMVVTYWNTCLILQKHQNDLVLDYVDLLICHDDV